MSWIDKVQIDLNREYIIFIQKFKDWDENDLKILLHFGKYRLQELEILVCFLCAPNNMFAYTIVQLIVHLR